MIARDNRFTVRLSDAEKADLEQLSAQLELDKSATIRRALKFLCRKRTHPQSGVFTTLDDQQFPIQFNRKESHELSS